MTVLKRSKVYDPDLAEKTLLVAAKSAVAPDGAPSSSSHPGRSPLSNGASTADRLLLIELGLADAGVPTDALSNASSTGDDSCESDDASEDAAAEYPAGSSEAAATAAAAPDGVLDRRASVARPFKGSSMQRRSQDLSDRAARMAGMMREGGFGWDNTSLESPVNLLAELSRHVGLLQRGNDSLHESATGLRRTSKEREERLAGEAHGQRQEHEQVIRDLRQRLAAAKLSVHQSRRNEEQLKGDIAQARRDLEKMGHQVEASRESAEAAAMELTQQLEVAAARERELQGRLSEMRRRSRAEIDERPRAEGVAEASLAHVQQLLAARERETEERLSELRRQLCVEVSAASARLADERLAKEQLQLLLSAREQEVRVANEAREQERDAGTERLKDALSRLAASDRALEAVHSRLAAALEELETLRAERAAGDAQNTVAAASLERRLLEARAEGGAARSQLEYVRRSEASALEGLKAMQLERARLQRQLADAEARLGELRSQCQAQQDRLEAARSTAVRQAEESGEKLDGLQRKLEAAWAEIGALKEERHMARQQSLEASESLAALEARHKALKGSAGNAAAERDELAAQLAKATTREGEAQAAYASEVSRLHSAARAVEAAMAAAAGQFEAQLGAMQREAAEQLEDYKRRWSSERERRRTLHNQVVQLRGNIRVMARVRPLSAGEQQSDGPAPAVQALDEERVAVGAGAGQRGALGAKEFEFDRVFGPGDDQRTVFGEVAPLVDSVLDGYNVCVFAYGQTGSGKTHTMEGPSQDPGVYTRALDELFRLSMEVEGQVQYGFSASVLEIYNEQLFDLLSGNKDNSDKLEIKQWPDGMLVQGLRVEAVRSMADVSALLLRGKQNRSTFATNMNEHSSRSHLALTVYVMAADLATGVQRRSKLHLIDLAGSERVGRSGAEGDRLKEVASINKSLSALGDVIQALQQQSQHVPYRNSKLTRLLEDSLGGSSKVCMIVNCSAAAQSLGETKCSLEFASRARSVALGAARRSAFSSDSMSVQAASAGNGCHNGNSRTRLMKGAATLGTSPQK